MEKINIIKAWKDPKYRASLTQEQLESLPKHPAGVLGTKEQDKVRGGNESEWWGYFFTISAECNESGGSCNPFV